MINDKVSTRVWIKISVISICWAIFWKQYPYGLSLTFYWCLVCHVICWLISLLGKFRPTSNLKVCLKTLNLFLCTLAFPLFFFLGSYSYTVIPHQSNVFSGCTQTFDKTWLLRFFSCYLWCPQPLGRWHFAYTIVLQKLAETY